MGRPRIEPKLELDGTDLYVVVDGLRIAKRGPPGTQAAKAWIPLERGWAVLDSEGGAIYVEYRPWDDD